MARKVTYGISLLLLAASSVRATDCDTIAELFGSDCDQYCFWREECKIYNDYTVDDPNDPGNQACFLDGDAHQGSPAECEHQVGCTWEYKINPAVNLEGDIDWGTGACFAEERLTCRPAGAINALNKVGPATWPYNGYGQYSWRNVCGAYGASGCPKCQGEYLGIDKDYVHVRASSSLRNSHLSIQDVAAFDEVGEELAPMEVAFLNGRLVNSNLARYCIDKDPSTKCAAQKKGDKAPWLRISYKAGVQTVVFTKLEHKASTTMYVSTDEDGDQGIRMETQLSSCTSDQCEVTGCLSSEGRVALGFNAQGHQIWCGSRDEVDCSQYYFIGANGQLAPCFWKASANRCVLSGHYYDEC